MKKVVQSRWKGCPLSASQVRTLGQYSSRCRFAIDRGAFSDLEVSTVLRESDGLEPAELDQQKTGNSNPFGHKSGNLAFADGERLHSSKSLTHPVSVTRYPRRVRARLDGLSSASEGKPKEKICELIANVFKSERKSQMKKADIVALLKSRYPYFKNLRKSECRISEVLTRNPAFKLIGPGLWALIGPDGEAGQCNRPRKRTRVRRRPDVLRQEWKLPGCGTKLTRRQSSRMDTSTESEGDTGKLRETALSSSLSLEEALADFNKNILERVIEEITKANEKCFENLIATMKSNACDATKTALEGSKLPGTVRKNNQQLLQETIDKLIADNEKCLMDLNQSTAEYGNSCVPDLQWPKSTGYETTKSNTAMVETVVSKTASPVCTETLNCSPVKSESARSADDKSSKIQKRDDIRVPHSIPTILKHNAKANNHIKFGKRVVPRLSMDSSADSAKNVSSSDSGEHDDDWPKRVVPRPKQRLIDLGLHAMKTVSPSANSTKKIRLSVDASINARSTKCSGQTNAIASERSDPPANVSKKSVSDVFAEYARRNSELKDIIAMIDPSLSSALNSQDSPQPTSKQYNDIYKENSRTSLANVPRPSSLVAEDKIEKDELPVNMKKKITTVPTTSSEAEPETSLSQAFACPSTSQRSSDAIIDVNRTSTAKRQFSRGASPVTQTSNYNRSTRFVSSIVTHSRPSSTATQARSQPSTITTQPRRGHSNGGIDIRYIPPYRWGYRPTGVTQQNRDVNPTFAPRGVPSYHVVYHQNARPSLYNRAIGPQLTLNSAVPYRRGNTLNDVRCRIRGATVLRFPIRK